jgi:peptidoglycan/LPS O-acetylase OafA/YrhL
MDGMRGVAAIAVVILHAPALFFPIRAPSAALAVDLFFVMSGFIISHAYEKKLRSGLTPYRFLVVRLIRLYPLYAVGLLLGLVEAIFEIRFGRTGAWTPRHLIDAFVFNLPMIPAPPETGSLAVSVFPLNPPGWSLFFEIFVNAIYVVALPKLSNKVLSCIAIASAAALLLVGIRSHGLDFGSHWDNFWGGFPRVIFSFSMGILIYRMREFAFRFRCEPMIILIICAGIFMFSPRNHAPEYQFICVILILPSLVFIASANEPAQLLSPMFQFLGVTSYAVYSLHFPLAIAAEGVLRKVSPSLAGPWFGLLFLILLLVGCALVDKIYDVPVRRWLTGLRSSLMGVRV